MIDEEPCAALPPSCSRRAVIACATVIEELRPLLAPGTIVHVLDLGLHVNPQELKRMLQDTVDALAPTADAILLGYGLCSMAVVGLRARGCTVVVPRVDDCIALFLGSRAAYREQARGEPGTYYLTKGWIQAGDDPFARYGALTERYGEDRARWLIGQMLRNYTRLALIDTGNYEIERYRTYTRRMAARLSLRYEEIPGSNALLRKMLDGPWDDDMIVARPGETISYADFRQQ